MAGPGVSAYHCEVIMGEFECRKEKGGDIALGSDVEIA